MSLFGALSAALTSLTAQSRAINVISNNVANLSTTGYKGTTVSFATLVAGTSGGGVIDSLRSNVSEQGSITSTGVGTDLAIQGNGFFTVKDSSGNLLYTRSGSFRPDSTGNLVNEAGYVLQGWPLDTAGRLPGESGNTNTTSNQDLASLVPVSTSSITGTASPTNQISTKINLKAEESILEGAGSTLTPQSTANKDNTATSIIVPNAFANNTTLSVTTALGTSTFTYGGIAASTNISGGIYGATAANQAFTIGSGTGTALANGQQIQIQSSSMSSPATFTFESTSDTTQNQFKNLNELATVINATSGLRATVSGGVLYVSSTNAQDAVTFTDVGGASLKANLGLTNVTSTTANRFASLGELNDYVNSITASAGIKSSLNSSSSTATLKIYNIDPTDTIQFASSDVDFLTEFNLPSTLQQSVYDPTDASRNMASGAVSSDFSRTITIYDSLGKSLDLRLAFTKIADSDTAQKWAVELYSADPAGVNNGRGGADGLIAYGTLNFNGDGTLASISGPTVAAGDKVFSIAGDIFLDPAGGASSQKLDIDFGTIGKADGMSQFAGSYSVDNLSQNGFPTGKLQSLQIDAQGYVTAVFDNSLTSKVFKLPLAYFSNPNGLTAETGNAYSSNIQAGEVTLDQVGDANVGSIVPSSLEESTSEIGTELTDLVVSQQAYSAAANVLRKVNDLFDELKNI